MIKTGLFLPVLALLSSLAAADCVVPERVQGLPDGTAADKATMLSAHRQVWDFVEAADRYLDCLDREEAAAAGSESEVQRRQRIQAYNAVVSQMSSVTERLKREIAAFNVRR